MAATLFGVLVLACVVFVDVAHCDIHGYNDKLLAAFNASGALDNTTVDAELLIFKDCKGKEFTCDTSIDEKCSAAPTSVHRLCPNHIGVISALGDSITAAMGAQAKSILTNLIEYRGVSWSIGGNDDVSSCATLPNILKRFNPNLKGYSKDSGDEDSSAARMNVAVSGAISQDMPEQAMRLVDKLKADNDINFEEDWKVVTMWIGGNNLCAYCDNDKHTADLYIASIQEALDILHTNLPRTFVNMVQILDVSRIAALSDDTFDFLTLCYWVHELVCKCAKGDSKESVQEATVQYQERIQKLVDSGRYDTKDDFTVVMQPFFVGIELPLKDGEPDTSYFAPDCFHFSVKGHREAAIALWNNMLEPVGAKSSSWTLGQPISCPSSASPYLYTSENSQQGFNSQSADEDEEEDGSGGHILGVILGSSMGAAVAVGLASAVVVGVVWAVRRGRRGRRKGGSTGEHPTPKTALITKSTKL